GTEPIQWWNNGQNNQKWVFATGTAAGIYTMQNSFNGLYLEDAAGTLIEALPSPSQAHNWTLKILSTGAYLLANQATGRVIDDANCSTDPGNGLITWTPNGGANQGWVLAK